MYQVCVCVCAIVYVHGSHSCELWIIVTPTRVTCCKEHVKKPGGPNWACNTPMLDEHVTTAPTISTCWYSDSHAPWPLSCSVCGVVVYTLPTRHSKLMFYAQSTSAVISGRLASQGHHSSGAVWESRWTSWAVRPNEPSGFRGRKELLNRVSALVTTCP